MTAAPAVLVSSTTERSWAWTGVRIEPAPLLSDHQGWADRPESARLHNAAAAELAWLRAMRLHTGTSFELRLSSRDGRLDAALLGRASGTTAEQARQAAGALAAALLHVPRHVHAVPVGDETELAGLLALPGPVDGDPRVHLRELRKTLTVRPLSRHAELRPWTVTTSRLAESRTPWDTVWTELAARPAPTVLAVCLHPYEVPAALTAHLEQRAHRYAALATPGPGNPVWGGRRGPDHAAQAARDHYADAAVRYARHCYQLRITLASLAPLPPGLAERVAEQLGAPGEATAVPVAPAEGEEHRVARHGLRTLDLHRLPHAHRTVQPPELVEEFDLALADLADPAEAAVAFRLPYALPARPALFHRLVTPLPAAPPPGAGRPTPLRPTL
ncbi:hypothetical protein K353_04128 [Kitasatospora sp. SolWspMP-SS2h]|uniref:hypothetical protein n=1 Tax=Kitasatospora sp. SolWspMP-SS2h TaxID=1305729 RepID=UPI000DBF6AD6|nr:hypothetical protein [Kitasatospora sp. SolWspMP-SS2h]RAJ38577.1 hypothetical protein K353_04128 [Kitasatospora sp. SolWspMP-SS2h]